MSSPKKYSKLPVKLVSELILVLWLVIISNHSSNAVGHPEDPDQSPGYRFILDSISACNEIRKAGPDGYHNIRLPEKFEGYLRESLEKAKAVFTQGVEVQDASKVKHNVMLPEAQGLESEVEELIRAKKLTLEQWNLFHLRLVLLFEKSLGYMWSQHYDPCQGIENATSSQESLIAYLNGHRLCRDRIRLNPYDSCAFSTIYELGVDELNRAFVEGVYPLGVVSQHMYADGNRYSPWEFFRHDADHVTTDTGDENGIPFTEVLRARLADKRKWGREFVVNRLPRYSSSDRVKLAFAYFIAHHEGYPVFNSFVSASRGAVLGFSTFNQSDSREAWFTSPYCNSSHGSYSHYMANRISSCTDLGSLIPQEVTQLLEALPLEIFGRLVFEHKRGGTLSSEDKFYYEAAALFCHEWANFRWPESSVKHD